jgi:radical SAM superfamily enzyme YgiQ (UPF0313 family)
MRVLLISTYELGHQPLHVASPAAALRSAGHEMRCLDLSIEPWDLELLDWPEAVAFSVPMHTAMRLAVRGAKAIRGARSELPICFYGLYAPIGRDLGVGSLADRVIGGEYEPDLVAWVEGLAHGDPRAADVEASVVRLDRVTFVPPARDLLPPLERYAHLAIDGEERPVGYVEASHGCVHKCRHCPVPVIYDGRIRIVQQDVVLEDIGRLVESGARHITFGDPDFLNGARHSLRVATAMHERFPDLTFDCTTKVEHILEYPDIWGELAAAGCLFVVSALEGVNDEILERLDKGHTTEQATAAIALLRSHGIEIRPSFLPFTPWTTLADVADIVDFVAEHDLVGNVDPIQFTIRLLLPEGSLLLQDKDLRARLGPYDRERLTYTWASPDVQVDELQERLASLITENVATDEPLSTTFANVRDAVYEAAGRPRHPPEPLLAGSSEGRPRLTEPWFC